MAILLTDNMTGTAGVVLGPGGHAADTSQAYSAGIPTGRDIVLSGDGACYAVTDGAVSVTSPTVLSLPDDYTVSVRVIRRTWTGATGVSARVSSLTPDAFAGYTLFIVAGSNIAALYRYVGGAGTSLGSVAVADPGSAGTIDLHLRTRTAGAAAGAVRLTAWVGNDTPFFDADDLSSPHTAIGAAALFFAGTYSPAAGVLVDSLSVVSGLPASVTSVTIDQSDQTVTTQTPIQFTAIVVVTGGAAQTVTWSKTGPGTLTSGGLFTPPARSSSDQVTTITATSTVDNTKSDSVTVTVSAMPATPATSYTLTGADTGTVGVAQTLTVTPVGGGYTGTISLPGCVPSSLTFANESGAKTVTYTPTSAGVKIISATASPTLGTNQTLEITVAAAPPPSDVTLYSPPFATGLVGTLGVKVVSAADVVKVALLTTGITEQTNAPGNYIASRDYVAASGDLIQWYDGATLLTQYRYSTSSSSGGSGDNSLPSDIADTINRMAAFSGAYSGARTRSSDGLTETEAFTGPDGRVYRRTSLGTTFTTQAGSDDPIPAPEMEP